MSSLKLLNQDAEHAKRFVALAMNINAAKGLQEVLKTNLGPKVSKCSKRARANRAPDHLSQSSATVTQIYMYSSVCTVVQT